MSVDIEIDARPATCPELILKVIGEPRRGRRSQQVTGPICRILFRQRECSVRRETAQNREICVQLPSLSTPLAGENNRLRICGRNTRVNTV